MASTTGVDWNAVRRQFPVLEHWTYLNSATFGPVPRCAVEAAAAHFAERDETASLSFLSWFDRADEVRTKLGRLIGAGRDDIAFIPNAGTALSWIIEGLDWREGDEILSLADEFPNNLYAPALMERRGVRSVQAPGGEDFRADEFLALVTSRTRLVLLSAVNYASGLRPPLERIGERLAGTGALFVVDGTQGVGAIEFDVEKTRADVVVVHGYKWMCCPTGSGFLYARDSARREIRPTVISWRSHREWHAVDNLHHGVPEFPEEAAKFEGGVQNFAGIFAMEAVADLFLDLGVETVVERVREMTEATCEALRAIGADLTRDRLEHFDSPIISARLSGVDVSALAAWLKGERVAVAARHGYLRVSPHFFNNEADIETLCAAIERYRS